MNLRGRNISKTENFPCKGEGTTRSTLVALTIKEEEEMPQEKFKCFSQRDF
jgi:hypothetical protein